MEGGVVAEEGFDGGGGDAGRGEVEVDGLGLGGEVEGDDDGVAASGSGADVAEDAGIGGIEHDEAAVVDDWVAGADGDEVAVPVEEGVGVGGFGLDVDGGVAGFDGEPGVGVSAEAGGGRVGVWVVMPISAP